MADAEFDQLLKEADEYTAAMREELRAMMPRVKAARECYVAYIGAIEKSPATLFSFYPTTENGGFAVLGAKVEGECADAVLCVLRRYLAKAEQVIGAAK